MQEQFGLKKQVSFQVAKADLNYLTTKRDIELKKFRDKQLETPTTIKKEIFIGKYEATEQRLQQLVMQLSGKNKNGPCAVNKLELVENQMNEAKTQLLCQAIIENQSLQTIWITKCRLRSQQLVQICQAISQQTTQSIQELRISALRVNKEGAAAIADVLTKNVGFQRLELIDAGIDCDCMLELCVGLKDSMSMDYLDLRQNIFDQKGLSALIQSLKEHMSVKHLALESMRFDHAEAEMLAEFFMCDDCMIEELQLNEADFDIQSLDTIMEALYKADHLKRLSLAKNMITKEICEHLSVMPQRLHHFQALCLSHCEIGEDGLKQLCSGFEGQTTIKYLDLSWNNISEVGMKIIVTMLGKNHSLEKLLIQHNYLKTNGAELMVRALKLHPEMKYLDISANEIGSKGFLHFCELFKHNHSLQNLHVRKNEIQGDEVQSFPESLRDNTNMFYLDLKDNLLDDTVAVPLLQLLDDNYFIEDLWIKGNLHLSQSYKETLREECRKNLFIKEHILPCLKCEQGRKLSLKLQPSVEEAHFKNYNVESLVLEDNSFFRSDFIVKFIKMNRQKFRELTLTRITFPGEHIHDLHKYLKNNANEIFITKLELDDCNIGDSSISQIIADVKKIKTLKELRLKRMNLNHGQHTKEILKAVVDHKRLVILDLSYNRITGLKDIATLAIKNHIIQEICLNDDPQYHNVIDSHENFEHLLMAMTQNKSIIKLGYDVSPHLLKNSSSSLAADQLLARGSIERLEYQIWLNRQIKELLWPIQVEQGKNGTDTLDLSKNLISVELIEAVAKYYCANSQSGIRKTNLILSETNLTDEGLIKLISSLQRIAGKTLSIDTLDLSMNRLTNMSCEQIASLLMKDISIKNIILGSNMEITLEGMRKVVKAARSCTRLYSLDFTYCSIDLKGQNYQSYQADILDDMNWNCSLCELKLLGNDIDSRLTEKLMDELDANQKIADIIVPAIHIPGKKRQPQKQDTMQQIKKSYTLTTNKKKDNLKKTLPVIRKKSLGGTGSYQGNQARKLSQSLRKAGHGTIDKNISGSASGAGGIMQMLQTNKIRTSIDDTGLQNLEHQIGIESIIEEDREHEYTKNSQNVSEFEVSSSSDEDLNQRKDTVFGGQEVQKLNLKGKGLEELDFLFKFIRCNPNIIDIDLSMNPLSDQELMKLQKHLSYNQSIRNVHLEGIKRLQNQTKQAILRESRKNQNIYEYIELPKDQKADSLNSFTSMMSKLALRNQGITDVQFITKFAKLNQIRELNLEDNDIDNTGAKEIADLIQTTETIEEINLRNNKIGAKGLQLICSSLAVNKSVILLDIRDNEIQDESLKMLLALLFKNQTITNILYSLKNEENIKRKKDFDEKANEGMCCEEIEEALEMDHQHEHLPLWQKIICCIMCWKSFMHDKHEAFRFKYCPDALNVVENEFMTPMTRNFYFNSFIYYIIMFIAPMIWANECGAGLDPTTHYIYAGYSFFTIVFELCAIWRIQQAAHAANILNINKWHYIELFMGQIARFDTYLDVCFFALMFQCGVWHLAFPIGIFILLYISYPLYTLSRLAFEKEELNHTLPGIERNCMIAFIRENMLAATVLDSFSIDNGFNLTSTTHMSFGRFMGIYTLLFQDGPQFLIHLYFMFFIQNHISHSELTVVMSLIVSGAFALPISIFNIVMCVPNEFDPILMEIELKKRKDKASQERKEVDDRKAKIKASMLRHTVSKLGAIQEVDRVRRVLKATAPSPMVNIDDSEEAFSHLRILNVDSEQDKKWAPKMHKIRSQPVKTHATPTRNQESLNPSQHVSPNALSEEAMRGIGNEYQTRSAFNRPSRVKFQLAERAIETGNRMSRQSEPRQGEQDLSPMPVPRGEDGDLTNQDQSRDGFFTDRLRNEDIELGLKA